MTFSQDESKKLGNKLRRQARTFTGEDLAVPVINWFEDPDCGPDDPVRELWDRANRPWLHDAHDTIKFIKQTEEKWDFHYHRVISVEPDGLSLALRHASNLPIGPEFTKYSKMLLAWDKAVQLSVRGLFDRIRVCARAGCGKLFFARFKHSEYHEDACRLAVEVANPEYKRSRREYMRKQRQQVKKGKRGKKS